MNILPKKSWHVKTRANIEKVRRDEANAAEEEKKRLKKVALAEQEARTSLLRARAQQKQVQSSHSNDSMLTGEESNTQDDSKALALVSVEDELMKHVNFFRESEEGKSTGGVNKEREEEKKAEQEKYEKSIGLLTYLGQSAIESQTAKPWYLTTKTKTNQEKEEDDDNTTDLKRKSRLDPMHSMNKYLNIKRRKEDPDGKHQKTSSRSVTKPSTQRTSTSSKLLYVEPTKPKHHKEHKKHKHKKDHKHRKHSRKEKSSHKSKTRDKVSVSSGPSIEQLRAERLRREAVEKARTKRLLSGKKDDSDKPDRGITEEPGGRYNSQFHPELARKHRPRENMF